MTEFLLARIAEDYEVAFGAASSPWSEGQWDGEVFGARDVLDRHGHRTATCYYGGTYGHILRFDPTRVLAEGEAKRRIVEMHWVNDEDDSGQHDCPGMWVNNGDDRGEPCPTLRLLGLSYADHPDYDEAWHPYGV